MTICGRQRRLTSLKVCRLLENAKICNSKSAKHNGYDSFLIQSKSQSYLKSCLLRATTRLTQYYDRIVALHGKSVIIYILLSRTYLTLLWFPNGLFFTDRHCQFYAEYPCQKGFYLTSSRYNRFGCSKERK